MNKLVNDTCLDMHLTNLPNYSRTSVKTTAIML